MDLSEVVSRDRRVTRLLSQWTAEEVDENGSLRYGGIRYTSRLGREHECWAVFEGGELVELERRSIRKDDADLLRIAERYRLTVH